MSEVRTRFAPSPTGYLHIGGARTALFNFAYAKHFGGKFFLRIEDTDFERSTKEFESDIIGSLKWLSILPEEEVAYQSQRLEIYKTYTEKLIKEGNAYYCFCSKELLEEDRNKMIAEGKKAMYNERCRGLSPSDDRFDLNKPHVVRFRVNRENGATTAFKDLIRNQFVTVANSEIDDFVIIREDGIPTYNFAVVIDDALMKITHVIRGDDHVSNTPKQVMIYKALGFEPPQFAHVSMILGSDGKRLSKRHGATAVNQYKMDGFLPEAVINYLIRLGWSHGNDEILSLADIIKFFDLKNISKSAATFNTEKFLWLNAHYIKLKDAFTLIDLINEIKDESEKDLKKDLQTFAIIESLKTRAKTVKEFRQKLAFYTESVLDYKTEILTEFKLNEKDIEGGLIFLKKFRSFIDDLPNLEQNEIASLDISSLVAGSIELIKNRFNEFLSASNETMKERSMIIRLALTGEKISPPIYEIIFALGKKRCADRIQKFIESITFAV